MILALVAAAFVCAANGGPDGAIELEEYLIVDAARSTQEKPFPAFAMLAPAGWAADGALNPRAGDPCGLTHALTWRVASPDGASALEIIPDAAWTESPFKARFSSCPARMVYDAEGYAHALAADMKLKATFLADARPRPDIVAPFNQAGEGYAPKTVATAGEFPFTLDPDTDGKNPAREGVLIAAIVISTPAPGIPENESRGYALPALLATGPQGSIDRGLVEAVRASALVNPNWARAMAPQTPGVPPPRIIADEPFPVRAMGESQTICGAEFSRVRKAPAEGQADGQAAGEIPAGDASIWRRADGRFFYLPLGAAATQR